MATHSLSIIETEINMSNRPTYLAVIHTANANMMHDSSHPYAVVARDLETNHIMFTISRHETETGAKIARSKRQRRDWTVARYS